MTGRWPFIGREAEVAAVLDRLAGAAHRGVLVSGAAGVGKTTLAQACLDRLADAGTATVRATASAAARQVPLGALAHLLPRPTDDTHAGTRDRSGLLRHYAATLTERGGPERLVLFVDDAHLLDDTSAILLHQVASTTAATLLVVVRSGEPCPEPLLALWKDRLLTRVDLAGLDRARVDEVLRAALRGPVDPVAVNVFAERCGGNMLFLRELVEGAEAGGSLVEDGGIWRLNGSLRPPERLIELVESRLTGLAPAERALLEVIAVGEPLGTGELSALTDETVLERLERHGLLASHQDGRRITVRLAKPVYGDVLRAGLSPMRLRTISRDLAQAVEATGARRREDALRIAVWRLEGGGADPDLMLNAATTARWHYHFALAERLARAAMDAGAGFDAGLLAAQLAILRGRGDQGEAELAELATQARTDAERGGIAVTRLDNIAIWHGDIDAGLRIATEAENTISDPEWRDEILARRCGIVLGTQGPQSGAEAAEPLLERTQGRALAWTCLIASRSWTRQGRFTDALAAADRGRTAAAESRFDWYPWLYVHFGCDTLLHAGRIDEAEADATRNYQDSLRDRSVEQQAFFAKELAKCALARGRVQTAIRYLREAQALFRQLGRPQLERFCAPHLVLALALAGQAEEAHTALAALDQLDVPATYYTGTDPQEARAWTLVAQGDEPAARNMLQQTADFAESVGDRLGAATALHTLARLGRPADTLARLTALAEHIEGDLHTARLEHVTALAHRDPERLQNAAESFADLGADLLAAEAFVDAAALLRRHNRQREATAADRRTAELIDRCEGATTPALRGASRHARLSPGERDAATLAAAGKTNKEIAAKLHVSVRTVETFLQRAYLKLGITSRKDLPEALNPTAPAGDLR